MKASYINHKSPRLSMLEGKVSLAGKTCGSGGEDGRAQPKMMQVPVTQASPAAQLDIHPNPASTWVAFTYDLQAAPEQAELVVRDVMGRVVFRTALQAAQQQQLWDTREVATGSYTVVLLNAGRELRTEKLIVKQ